jgi:hypothetical protein
VHNILMFIQRVQPFFTLVIRYTVVFSWQNMKYVTLYHGLKGDYGLAPRDSSGDGRNYDHYCTSLVRQNHNSFGSVILFTL